MQETWVRSLGWEDPLEKEMTTHSSTLAWKIPWTEEPGRLQSMGSLRVGHDWVTSLHFTATIFLVAQEPWSFSTTTVWWWWWFSHWIVSGSCDPMYCSLPGYSIYGILQASILEWVAISFSRGSSQPRNQTWVFCTAGRFFTDWAIREAHNSCTLLYFHEPCIKISRHFD